MSLCHERCENKQMADDFLVHYFKQSVISSSNPAFPPPGHLLDSFARAALWDSGLDYLHGTGHGVGCFLNVHEGPCGISYKTFADEPLEAGMIVSDGMTQRFLIGL